VSRFKVVAVALFTTASVAFAQQQADDINADRETTVQLDRILTSARDKGLPTAPIVTKARQGILLRAASARIVAAAAAVSRRLEEARDALAPSPIPTDIAAGQDALSTPGVTPAMLRAIRAERQNRPVAVAVGVLAQLVASGVKPARASDVVADLVRKQATDDQLVSFGNDINRDVSAGIGAMSSLNVRLQGLAPLLSRIAAPAPVPGLITTAPAAGGPPKPRP
jgi:hypothetical protein